MPEINHWIQRQLKKGYTKQKLKDYLIRKGYSKEMIAKVDSFKKSEVHNKPIKKHSYKKSLKFIFITLII
ncbi:hypothetical protein, partial [Streptococcus pseudopneumoniae]|uniref:hypothetical protein n=1 Tax=Streptococcus pseudopneumoniae TaxID=257758 RepID=UPI001BB17660